MRGWADDASSSRWGQRASRTGLLADNDGAPDAAQAGWRSDTHFAARAILRAIITKDFSVSSKIYVGNLPYSVTDSILESNLAEFGAVASAKVMMDRETGRSKGFGFVEMASADFAQLPSKSWTVCPSMDAQSW